MFSLCRGHPDFGFFDRPPTKLQEGNVFGHEWLKLQGKSLFNELQKGTLENIQASGLRLAWPRTEVLFRRASLL